MIKIIHIPCGKIVSDFTVTKHEFIRMKLEGTAKIPCSNCLEFDIQRGPGVATKKNTSIYFNGNYDIKHWAIYNEEKT